MYSFQSLRVADKAVWCSLVAFYLLSFSRYDKNSEQPDQSWIKVNETILWKREIL